MSDNYEERLKKLKKDMLDYRNPNAHTCPYCGWDIKIYVENAATIFKEHLATHEKIKQEGK